MKTIVVNKILMAGMIITTLGLSGCVRPYGPAETVINKQITTPQTDKPQTIVTITRNKQFIGGGSGGMCRFLLQVDGVDVAKLRQNQFLTAYLNNGPHTLRVTNECFTWGMRKTLNINTDGTPQEYLTENGFWGQFRLWQVK